MQEQYDFVAQHASSHVVLGSGERIEPTGPLPYDAGTHIVAGKARLGGFEVLGRFPPRKEGYFWDLSPDHRWLGIWTGETVTLHDLHNRLRPGFSFEAQARWRRHLSIHPSGEMIALRNGDAIQIALPDGQMLTSADFPAGKASFSEHLSFSACGEYLWLAHHPPDGPDQLLLLRVPSLEVLDRIAVPFDQENTYDHEGRGWAELSGYVNPATNHLVLDRTAGDSFLGVTFHSVERGRIALHSARISSRDWDPNHGFDAEPILYLAFAADGKRFAGIGKYGFVFEWTWPECTLTGRAADYDLRLNREDDRDLSGIAYKDNLILTTYGEGEADLNILHSGAMSWAGVLPVSAMGYLLANGMVCSWAMDGSLEVKALRPLGEMVPVVIELASDINRVLRVMQRQDAGWIEITDRATWVAANFELARWRDG